MVDQENLQEAWDKARTLKAHENLAAIDPDRTLLADMLTSMYSVSPHGLFNPERHNASRGIRDFLTGENEATRENYGTVIQRNFIVDKLVEIAVDFEKGSRLYPSQEEVAIAMQLRIQHADPVFQQWLGNPFEGTDIPTPRWLQKVQEERALAL